MNFSLSARHYSRSRARFAARLGAGFALVALAAACSSSSVAPTPADLSAVVPLAGVVKLDEAGWRQLRQQQRGRVLVVNFWATWCEPCREEFPALVRLDRAYRARGLTLAAISMDETESAADVREFLKSQDAQFGTFLHDFHDFAAIADSIDPKWGGGIPATFIYDRQGKLVQSWEGAAKFEEFDRVVRPLLP